MSLLDNNVCRLCLSKGNLVWVFDKRLDIENNLKEVILITSGVEIYENDVISQMICDKCCRISIRMFQFRKASQKNDRYLKKQYEEMHKTSSVEHDISNTGPRIETEKKVEPEVETKKVNKRKQRLHQSVRNLLNIYPRLKLPLICLESNIEPCIIIEMGMVENVPKKETKSEEKCARLPEPENRITKNSTSSESTSIDRSHIFALSFENAEKNSDIEHFNSIQNQPVVSVSESVDEHSNNADSFSSDVNDKIIIKPKKRRLTDSDIFSDAKAKNFSSSEPLPEKKPILESTAKSCPDESVPLFLCSICNSVHNNVRELKRHQFKHLRCPFCKAKFKTIGLKKVHIQSLCEIKKIMNHLPSVKLKKIELDLRMRTKYPEAFIDYPLMSGLNLNSSSTEETSGDKPSGEDHSPGNQTSEKDKRVVGWDGGYNDNYDIIEILSDDDNSLPGRKETCNIIPISAEEIVPVPNVTQRILNGELFATNSIVTKKVSSIRSSTNNPIVSTTSSLISSTAPVILNTQSSISTPPVISTTPLVISTTPPVVSTTSPVVYSSPPVILNTCQVISKAPEDNLSSALVKPEIRIRNSSVLDTIDLKLSDIRIFKELLTKNTSFKAIESESSQTESPCNKSISVNERGRPTEFKNLKTSLYSYKIPILSKKGEFQVRYVYKSSDSKPRRKKKNKLCLWKNLTPIDVKVKNKNSSNRVANRIPVIVPKVTTPNIPTTGFTGNCTTSATNAFNHSYATVQNQQLYNRNDSFSHPVSSFTGSSNVHVYTQAVPSNFGMVSEAPYVLVGTNTSEQQSKTNTTNSFAASNVQLYPQNVNMTSSVLSNFSVTSEVSVAKDPTYVLPGLQTKPISFLNDPPNVNSFVVPNMAAPNMTPVVSQNSMNNASNISNSHSMIFNLQNSLTVQNKVPDPVPNRLPITNASGSYEAGPVFGSIRVKSVWELT